MSSSSSSSLSTKPSKVAVSHSQPTSSSKAKFIWRFPPSKFDALPSCNSLRLFSVGIQPISIDDELLRRQELSIFIFDLGSRVNVSFTCIYTGVVYMHRFFMLHAFQQCVQESVASACLFLACKVHEMPRPLIEFSRHLCKLVQPKQNGNVDSSSPSSTPEITPETLSNYSQQIVEYENMLLSTLAFCLTVEQPYMIITRTSQTLSMSMEIAQKAYDMATKCIFFTHFSIKYTTNLIACFALYLAAASAQINMPDNEDGSQWFHLLNEEFTEKLLKELADEYKSVYTDKCSTQFKQRFEQIRQQKKLNSQQHKSKSSFQQSNSTLPLPDGGPVATTSGSVRSTTSSSSIPQQHTNSYESGSYGASIPPSVEQHHHTPNQASTMTFVHGDYSPSTGTFSHPPTTVSRPSSPARLNQTSNISGQHHSTNSSMLISSAQPIPTLMTSSTSFHSSSGPRHHSHFAAPVFKHPPSPSAQRPFHPAPPHLYHPQYPPNYLPASSYYPPQQPTLFYHPPQDPLAVHSKRYGEPPAPPMKRFRHNINTQQHY